MSGTLEQKAWKRMKARCTNPNCRGYDDPSLEVTCVYGYDKQTKNYYCLATEEKTVDNDE